MNPWPGWLAMYLAMMAAPACVLAGALAAGVSWTNPSEIELRVDFAAEGYTANWQLFRCDCGDLLVRSELSEPGEAVQGDIMLVANRAVLVRGLGGDAAEVLSIDAPALMMQLALRLLERGEPAGPAAVTERRELAVDEPVNHIHLESGAAVGGFPAPWSLKGALWPVSETARRFDLRFEFNTGGVAGVEAQRSQLRLAGTAEFASRPFPHDDGLVLADWTLSWRDAEDPLAAGGAQPATLGELRQLIRATPRQTR